MDEELKRQSWAYFNQSAYALSFGDLKPIERVEPGKPIDLGERHGDAELARCQTLQNYLVRNYLRPLEAEDLAVPGLAEQAPTEVVIEEVDVPQTEDAKELRRENLQPIDTANVESAAPATPPAEPVVDGTGVVMQQTADKEETSDDPDTSLSTKPETQEDGTVIIAQTQDAPPPETSDVETEAEKDGEAVVIAAKVKEPAPTEASKIELDPEKCQSVNRKNAQCGRTPAKGYMTCVVHMPAEVRTVYDAEKKQGDALTQK